MAETQDLETLNRKVRFQLDITPLGLAFIYASTMYTIHVLLSVSATTDVERENHGREAHRSLHLIHRLLKLGVFTNQTFVIAVEILARDAADAMGVDPESDITWPLPPKDGELPS